MFRISFLLSASIFCALLSRYDGDGGLSTDVVEYRSAAVSPDSLREEPERYQFDSILKGGYSLVFNVDDDLQHLYLKKDTIIAEIASCSRGLLQKNLGYVPVDFPKSFVLVHSYGSGNAHEIEIIEKKTARVLYTGVYVDADEKRQVLLFEDDADAPLLFLYDAKSGRKETYQLPPDLDCINEFSCIELATVTKRRMTIRYRTRRGDTTRVYRRPA